MISWGSPLGSSGGSRENGLLQDRDGLAESSEVHMCFEGRSNGIPDDGHRGVKGDSGLSLATERAAYPWLGVYYLQGHLGLWEPELQYSVLNRFFVAFIVPSSPCISLSLPLFGSLLHLRSTLTSSFFTLIYSYFCPSLLYFLIVWTALTSVRWTPHLTEPPLNHLENKTLNGRDGPILHPQTLLQEVLCIAKQRLKRADCCNHKSIHSCFIGTIAKLFCFVATRGMSYLLNF